MPGPLSVRVPPALLEALDARVAQEARDLGPDSNRSAVVNAALRAYLGFEATGANVSPEFHERVERLEEWVDGVGAKLASLAENAGAM